MTPRLLGIAGGSASGKTTLVRQLQQRFGTQIASICYDSYYKAQHDKPMELRVRTNYDHPDALDTALFVEHLRLLRQGEPVQLPIYDFARHDRALQTKWLSPAPIVIADGILLLHEPQIRALLDYTVFIDAPAEVRLARRIRRDVLERGRSEESVRAQVASTVEPMYQAFVHPSAQFADLVGNGEDLQPTVALLCRKVEDYLAT